MKWLMVLVALGLVVYGFRWAEARLQRRLQPRSRPRPVAPLPRPPPQPPAAAPAPPSARPASPPPVEAPEQGFARGLSAVSDDGGGSLDDAPIDTPDTPDTSEDVGSYTVDDWGLKTVRQDAAPERVGPPPPDALQAQPPQPEPPQPEPPPPEPAAEQPLTVEFAGAPTGLLEAVGAQLEAGEAPDAADVEILAENPLTRAAVYGLLKDARKASLIPRKLRTQKAMAEADLVVWLVDSRLGRPPESIEQVAVHTLETRKGPMDWYLYRFRSQRRSFMKRGWMAGVSGPWIRSEGPGGRAKGDTGSDFEAWDGMSDEEHTATVRELMEAWSSRS